MLEIQPQCYLPYRDFGLKNKKPEVGMQKFELRNFLILESKLLKSEFGENKMLPNNFNVFGLREI